MVGSIGAVGATVNLSGLLEVEVLVHYNTLLLNIITITRLHNYKTSSQKLGVQPVILTSGERKGLGMSNLQNCLDLLELYILLPGNPLVAPSPHQLVDHQNLLDDTHLQFQNWVRGF